MRKTTFSLILVVAGITFFSCQKDDLSTNRSSVTSDGLLRGKIVNFVPNSIDSVSALIEYLVGSGKVSTTGDFSIGLKVPELGQIEAEKGVTISDPNARIGSTVTFYSYLNNNLAGALKKCNYTNDSIIVTGMAYSYFIYSDRTFTMKGTTVKTHMYQNTTQTYVFNITLNKGWNELVREITSHTSTVNSPTESISVTNNITSDIQWQSLKEERALF
jgi:hypothetical protein